jgi:hypothetical protein
LCSLLRCARLVAATLDTLDDDKIAECPAVSRIVGSNVYADGDVIAGEVLHSRVDGRNEAADVAGVEGVDVDVVGASVVGPLAVLSGQVLENEESTIEDIIFIDVYPKPYLRYERHEVELDLNAIDIVGEFVVETDYVGGLKRTSHEHFVSIFFANLNDFVATNGSFSVTVDELG